MPKYMMPWTVGMPAETQLSVVAMILSGAFDRLPSNAPNLFRARRREFCHFCSGRLENAWHHHPVARGECEHPPSHYLNRFYVDSAVFDQRAVCNFWWNDGNGSGDARLGLSLSAGRGRVSGHSSAKAR
jgi:aminocarboxymuconate-semialdehyde decarboxylase